MTKLTQEKKQQLINKSCRPTHREGLDKLKEKVRKAYIRNMTSEQYHIPADSKEMAIVKWIDVSVVFDEVIEEVLEVNKMEKR